MAPSAKLMDWKTAQFMEEHLGEEYDGLIISVQKYGCLSSFSKSSWKVFFHRGTRGICRERDACFANAITAMVALPGGRAAEPPARRSRGAKPAKPMAPRR